MRVFQLNSALYAHGFQLLAGANASGALGRKAWVGNSAGTAGCLFSTDYDAGQLWVEGRVGALPNSSALFSTAPSPLGPWSAAAPAPWDARVAPALVPFAGGTRLLVAGGFCMVNGAVTLCSGTAPTRADAWVVDAGVCLLAGTPPLPCSGKAAPNLDTVTCPCPSTFAGSRCEACAAGYFGPTCAPCSACSPLHGTCSGSGTQGGTGACMCAQGWGGSDCSTPLTTASPSPSTAALPSPPPHSSAPRGAAAKLSGGAAFGIALAVLAAVGAGAALVFAHFFGGGPTLARWGGGAWRGAARALAGLSALAQQAGGRGAAGAARSERASLLKALKAPPAAQQPRGVHVVPGETGEGSGSAFAGPAYSTL